MAANDLVVERLEAKMREADARMEALRKQAEARQAGDEMKEISGLTAAQERARKYVADAKSKTAANIETSRREAEKAVQDLKAGIERARGRYEAWDDARERQFYARLDEADARLRAWKAQSDRIDAERAMKFHDDMATLEERIALARAKSAIAATARHDRKAQEALVDAARHFDEAYDAAATRYQA